MAQLVIDKRYEGIPGVSLGGYVAGVAAKELGASVTVTLARVVVPGSTVTLERSESQVLVRVGDEARSLVEQAVGELEKMELNGLRPTLINLARSAVDRAS